MIKAYAVLWRGQVCTKFYNKIGYAKRWITDHHREAYPNIDDYSIAEFSLSQETPAIEFVSDEQLLKILKK